MSSYHNSFTYKGLNSFDNQGLIITSFEPDNGFVDTFLSMDPVYEDSYDGTKKFDYGARYNTSANIKITVIKSDGSDLTLYEFRYLSKWLTGDRNNSWLEMYDSNNEHVYDFLCKVTDLRQYKIDARTVGLEITFTSIAPWAYSVEQSYNCSFGQKVLIDDSGVLSIEDLSMTFNVDENGVLYMGDNLSFNIVDESGIIGIDNSVPIRVDNQTDDLYTYIKLDTRFENKKSDYLSIKNVTLDEETRILDMSENETITLSTEQFIVSNIPNKVFGDSFNFVWPRVAPGINDFLISGSGSGNVYFSFRYPMKVGDCTMDTGILGSGLIGREVSWDKITNKPTTIGGYGITDAYTIPEIDDMFEDIPAIDESELDAMLQELLG